MVKYIQNNLMQAGNALNEATAKIREAVHQLHQANELANQQREAHHTHIYVRIGNQKEQAWTSTKSVGDALMTALQRYDITSGHFTAIPGMEKHGEPPYIQMYKEHSVGSPEKVIRLVGCHCTENWENCNEEPPF